MTRRKTEKTTTTKKTRASTKKVEPKVLSPFAQWWSTAGCELTQYHSVDFIIRKAILAAGKNYNTMEIKDSGKLAGTNGDIEKIAHIAFHYER